jgi:hypothetical protein
MRAVAEGPYLAAARFPEAVAAPAARPANRAAALDEGGLSGFGWEDGEDGEDWEDWEDWESERGADEVVRTSTTVAVVSITVAPPRDRSVCLGPSGVEVDRVSVATRIRPIAPNSTTMIPSMSGRRAGRIGAMATSTPAITARIKWSDWPQIRTMPRGP